MNRRTWLFLFPLLTILFPIASSAAVIGDEPRLGPNRITQNDITSGQLTLEEIQTAGLKVFATPFNKADGAGDGPINPADTVSPGGRPTLQGNGYFMRVNGLDAQACLECHSVLSNAVIPATFTPGGAGGISAVAMPQPTNIDVTDVNLDGVADYNGRLINPPFLFGSGGVELIGKEMTIDLQAIKSLALANPGITYNLDTKGISFGSISADTQGIFDTTNVTGIDNRQFLTNGDPNPRFLVVQPFGRKGEFISVRDFDLGAMRFHFGMQPIEVVPSDTATAPDGTLLGDRDGVENEILTGEMTALSVWQTTLDRPTQDILNDGGVGADLFSSLGCSACHTPILQSDSTILTYSFPEVAQDPTQNIAYQVDLAAITNFTGNNMGGIRIPLYSDLKRHDMGAGLAESSDRQRPNDPDAAVSNSEFITARLWGVADTAPYLHDGRALTLNEAILMHGGEAQTARDNYNNLPETSKNDLIGLLLSLRTPGSGGPEQLITLDITVTPFFGGDDVELQWSGIVGSSTEIYRNGSLLVTRPTSDGSYIDKIFGWWNPPSSYTYKVCEVGGTPCSPDVIANL